MTTNFPASLIAEHDAARLHKVHQFQITNTTPEPIFDDYATWAAQLFGVPIALISLVDAEYVWLKALTGARGIPGLARKESMCSAAILSSDDVVLSDYKTESCAFIKPDVAQAHGLNFYAGAALVAQDNSHLGMLAVIDKEARDFSAAEAALLESLAGLVSRTIELRYRSIAADQLAEWEEAQRELTKILADNSAPARSLTARHQSIDLSDAAAAQPISQRLDSVAQVLSRRLS